MSRIGVMVATTERDQIDVALIARLANGETAILEELYDAYGGLVYSLALRILHDVQAAEEVTQEVFVRLWRHAGSFTAERGQVRPWLLRIAHNLALNEVRRRQSRPIEAETVEEMTDDQRFVDESTDPALQVSQREESHLVRQALTSLSPQQREAIELAYFGGLSQSEIASRLGEPLGTIKGRIRNGMQRLKTLLEAAGIVLHE